MCLTVGTPAAIGEDEMTMTTSMRARKLHMILAGLAIGFAASAYAADTTTDAPDGVTAAREKIKAGDFAGAMPLLAAVIKDAPKNADALNLMGFSLRKTGKASEALDYYNRALALEPKHLGANEYLGELYVEMGQLDKAKERLAVLEAACGKTCEQTRELTDAIAKAQTKK